jgi:hypothetical protein
MVTGVFGATTTAAPIVLVELLVAEILIVAESPGEAPWSVRVLAFTAKVFVPSESPIFNSPKVIPPGGSVRMTLPEILLFKLTTAPGLFGNVAGDQFALVAHV